MFERFTERARQVVVLAQDEARALKHNYIGTEHLLLGLLREEEGVAARVLESLDIGVDAIRGQVARIVGLGDEVATGQIPFTPRAKKVLELSLREALSLGHNYIGTEHILLGLAREDEGVAARILLDFGADAERIRDATIATLSGSLESAFVPESPPVAPEAVAELERIRSEKERALEAQEFERAAGLRAQERSLMVAMRQLTRAWKGEPDLPMWTSSASTSVRAVPTPGTARRHLRREQRRRMWQAEALVVGWTMFGIAAGIGVLLGWLIWG